MKPRPSFPVRMDVAADKAGLTRAGRTVDARAAARTYFDQYPGGARAAEMTALTAP